MIPTVDEIGGQFGFDDLLQASNGGQRGAAKRVAIEVHDRFVRNEEFVAKGRQWILLVKKLGIGS